MYVHTTCTAYSLQQGLSPLARRKPSELARDRAPGRVLFFCGPRELGKRRQGKARQGKGTQKTQGGVGNPLPQSIAEETAFLRSRLRPCGGDMFFTFKSFQLSTRRGQEAKGGGDSRHRVTDSRSEKVYFPFLEETSSSSAYGMSRAAAPPQVGNLSVKELGCR